MGTAALINSNKEDDVMKIVKPLEESGSLVINGVIKTVKNETKKPRRFLAKLLVTFGASLLENMLPDKREVRGRDETIQAGEGTKAISRGRGANRPCQEF